MADILRDLREIPEQPPAPDAPTHARLPLFTAPIEEPLIEVPQPPRSPLPVLLQPQSTQPLPPTITTITPSRIRHSFSSLAGPARPDAGADVVVELHEESASAFQDFLFWAYPQYVVSSRTVTPLLTSYSTVSNAKSPGPTSRM